jgi:hypothetical protein
MERLTEVRSTESRQGRMSTVTIRGTTAPDKLVGVAISLIGVVGFIHLIDATGNLQDYQGLLELANFFGALTAAVGIYRGHRWGWALGALVAGGAFAGYVISRTVGLPGLPVEEEWLEPLGLLSLLVESLFVGIFLMILAPSRSIKEARTLRASSSSE